jgi:hypothetical protein
LIIRGFKRFKIGAGYVVLASAGVCGKREVWVKGFADACYKGVEGVACCKG